MMVKVGDPIEHNGTSLVIVGIQRTENTDGVSVYVTACDKDLADREQHKAIKAAQTHEDVIEMVRKMTKGELPGSLGFGISGPGEDK